jgi:hypothetical protein
MVDYPHSRKTIKGQHAKVVYHADWGSRESKRWCAKAVLDADGCYKVNAPTPVGAPELVIKKLREEAGELATVFAGFDFPIGVPAHFAQRAGISKFLDLLPELGKGKWSDFYSVCNTPEEISEHRPFYPNGQYKGRRKQDLFDGHGVSSCEPLLRRCEHGGNGQKKACCLFWTLGGNQVGKAALRGWKDLLMPALQNGNRVRLWPFDGLLCSLLEPGRMVIAETYPAQYYDWFREKAIRSKGDRQERSVFFRSLLSWADNNMVSFDDDLRRKGDDGFTKSGDDDAFDALVGLLGMLSVVKGQRPSGEPDGMADLKVEGWILGRTVHPAWWKTCAVPASAI